MNQTDDQLIEMYIDSRNKIDAIQALADKEIQPHKMRMELIGKLMMARFNDRGSTSTKCDTGTAFVEEKDSASLANPAAFFDFVVETESWDLLEKRAAKLAVRNYIQTKKELPPGVNYTVRKEVVFRKPSAS
jgi:hypothetical protein